jgi:hypothetical protein
VDPERQWIARLESETPVEPAPELVDEDLGALRPIALAVGGVAALAAAAMEWRARRSARKAR